jgi:hypothetical protein
MNYLEMDRRKFLVMTATFIAVAPLVGVLSSCGTGGNSAAQPSISAGDFTVTSSTVALHTHTITVKASDLTAGIQVVYSSTTSSGHTHTVTITAAEINDLNSGKTDTISSSTDSGHAHDFSIKKP